MSQILILEEVPEYKDIFLDPYIYEFNNIEMIDNNHFYLPHFICSSGLTTYIFYSISYHKDSNNLVRNYNQTFEVSVTALDVDRSTKSFVINQISIQLGKEY